MQVMLDKINCPVVYATLEVLVMHLGRVAEAANRMDIDNLGLLFGQVMTKFTGTHVHIIQPVGASLARSHGSSRHEVPFR